MKLQSVHDLKSELLEELRSSTLLLNPLRGLPVAKRSAQSHTVRAPLLEASLLQSFSVAAGPHAELSSLQRSVALGVSLRDRQYYLAVRVQRPELMRSPVIEKIKRRARGDADIRVVGRIEKRTNCAPPICPWYRTSSRPLLIGCSAGHVAVTAGTVAGFVRRGQKVFALSNNHVFANEDRAQSTDMVLQPGVMDGGQAPRDAFGRLGPTVRLDKQGVNRVDAALATLESVDHCEAGLLRGIRSKDRHLAGLGPEDILGATVFKIGRTSGPTEGRVTAVELDNVIINYDVGPLQFDGQMEIQGSDGMAFSYGGDSGALIVDGDFRAVGLLFAGSDAGGANRMGLTYAHPIRNVLTALKGQLVC